jgi:hypothetical protein
MKKFFDFKNKNISDSKEKTKRYFIEICWFSQFKTRCDS